MFVLSLCNQLCPDKIPVSVGDRLGDGSDGEVFSIRTDPNKVIKFCILYERLDRGLRDYDRTQKVLEYMLKEQPEPYAKLYEYGHLGDFTRKVVGRRKEQPYVMYYYVMEKLQKLSEDEKKVFHTILSHEDRGIEKNYSSEKIREMLQGLGRGLDFDAEKVTLFCDNIRSAPVSHLDLHVRNIMKDMSGHFKLIDFDRSILENDNGKR
jgi:hypothetical protein